MKIHHITKVEDIPLSESQWNSLVSNNSTNTVFQTYQWFHSWWETYGDDYTVLFLYAEDEEGMIGFAPLMSPKRKSKTEIRFSSDTNSDYNDFIAPRHKTEFIKSILLYLINTRDNKTKYKFINIPDESDTPGIIREFFHARGIRRVHKASTRTPTLLMSGKSPSPTEILGKYSIRRPLNYFKKLGTVSFRTITNATEGLDLLDVFFDQHVKRCSIADYESLFKIEKNREFYRKLYLKLLPTHWVSFSVLELDGKPIAFHYGFDYQSKVIWYKPSFDISLRNHSPGILLMRFLIKQAIENSRTELDMTIGNETFKSRFSNYERSNINTIVYMRYQDYLFDGIMKCLYSSIKKLYFCTSHRDASRCTTSNSKNKSHDD